MTDFYKDKKVVVTGGAGFLGKHLIDQLLEREANVVVVIDDFSRGKNRVQGAEYFLPICANKVFEQADMVFNLAARVAGVEFNQKNHYNMFTENIKINLRYIQLAQQYNISRFLQVSSVCVYPDEQTNPCDDYKEIVGNPNQANDGYAWSKRMGESLVKWSSIPFVVIARPSNLFGPLDYFDDKTSHVIPSLIKKVLSGKEFDVFGTGNEIREFIYVKDAADGLVHLMEHGLNREAYNLGTNGRTQISIKELLQLIQSVIDVDSHYVFSTKVDSGDSIRWSNCDKIESTGWKYKTGLDIGLRSTIEWYLKHEQTTS